MGEAFAVAGDQRPVHRTPSGRRWSRSATRSSPRSTPPEGERATRTASGRRAASHAAVPEGGRGGAAAGRAARRAGRGPARAARLARRERDGRRDPARGCASRSSTASATRAPRRWPGSRPCAGSPATLFYALPDLGTGRNPNWDAIGYPGPIAPPPDRPRPLEMHRPEGAEEVIEADVCIVGSGAGGGVIAGELAAAGK